MKMTNPHCNPPKMEAEVKSRFALALQTTTNCLSFQRVGGGSINQTFRVDVSGSPAAFFKMNSATKFPQLLECEKRGLEKIRSQHIIKTPAVIDCFESVSHQYLLLEWVPAGEHTDAFWKLFGRQLAELHSCSQAAFGLDHNNYMGSIPQTNTFTHSWPQFFMQYRLTPLIRQCHQSGLLQNHHLLLFEKLHKNLIAIFGPNEKPSFLHGDLWSGNFICDKQQQPVLIDPATYFGHRSIDLGMTTLFGGFHPAFYESYQYHAPLPKNHEEQWHVCNLYPLLIHLALFGHSYLRPIESILHTYR